MHTALRKYALMTEPPTVAPQVRRRKALATLTMIRTVFVPTQLIRQSCASIATQTLPSKPFALSQVLATPTLATLPVNNTALTTQKTQSPAQHNMTPQLQPLSTPAYRSNTTTTATMRME